MKTFFVAILTLLVSSAQAFVAPKSNTVSSNSFKTPVTQSINSFGTSTTLNERQWNFNEGRGPFGLKKNAEIWNGRVAQVGFTVVLLQEFITGKGVIEGIQEGNIFNLAMLGLTVVSTLGLSVFLASKGKNTDIKLE